MRSIPYPCCIWMKSDPHPPAEHVMDVKDTGYVQYLAQGHLITGDIVCTPGPWLFSVPSGLSPVTSSMAKHDGQQQQQLGCHWKMCANEILDPAHPPLPFLPLLVCLTCSLPGGCLQTCMDSLKTSHYPRCPAHQCMNLSQMFSAQDALLIFLGGFCSGFKTK